MISIFFQGLGIGIAIAVVVGPIAILTIRKTLAEGQAVGLAISFGAALGDVVYATIAGFGISYIADFLKAHQIILRIIGSLFLFYLGIKTFFEKPTQPGITIHAHGLINVGLGALLLNLTNPITIGSFTVIFAGLGIGVDGFSPLHIVSLVAGVFVGAMIWSVILTTILTCVRSRFTAHMLELINKSSGILLMIFGACGILSLVVRW